MSRFEYVSPEFAKYGMQSVAHESQIFNPSEENIIDNLYQPYDFARLSSVEEFKKLYNFLKFEPICKEQSNRQICQSNLINLMQAFETTHNAEYKDFTTIKLGGRRRRDKSNKKVTHRRRKTIRRRRGLNR